MGPDGGDDGDWASWEAVPLPCEKYNFWNEPYAELYDWYPWMRKFYTNWEIEHNCLPVRDLLKAVSLLLLLLSCG